MLNANLTAITNPKPITLAVHMAYRISLDVLGFCFDRFLLRSLEQ